KINLLPSPRRGAGWPTVAGHITTAVRLGPAPTLTGGGAMGVVAAQAQKASRPLIPIGAGERGFKPRIGKEMAQTLKLPGGADIARFAQSIRISARIFLEAKGRLSAPQFRAVIERLYQLNTRAEDGNDLTARALARAVDAMPADVRQWLRSGITLYHRNIPTP